MKRFPLALATLFLSGFLVSCSESEDTYEYCVDTEKKICLLGPFTICQNEGLLLSNSCPYESNLPSSSSNALPSSSSSSMPTSSSSSLIASDNNSFTDSRDGQTYSTVKIGSQIWMAKNLDFDAPSSTCYKRQNSYCEKYGRMYNWATAKEACPSGWHLPTKGEWDTLNNTVGGTSTAGKHLKATSGWNSYNGQNGNGLDTYGFAALPGSFGDPDGNFENEGNGGLWWSASEDGSEDAWGRVMGNTIDGTLWYDVNKDTFISVRCVKD